MQSEDSNTSSDPTILVIWFGSRQAGLPFGEITYMFNYINNMF